MVRSYAMKTKKQGAVRDVWALGVSTQQTQEVEIVAKANLG